MASVKASATSPSQPIEQRVENDRHNRDRDERVRGVARQDDQVPADVRQDEGRDRQANTSGEGPNRDRVRTLID